MGFDESGAIEIERTEEFQAVAQSLSDYLQPLPLQPGDHNRLVELILRQIEAAEQGAFAQGLRMGMALGNYEERSLGVKLRSAKTFIQ